MTTKAVAVSAFARRYTLTRDQRKNMAEEAFGYMISRRRAWNIVKLYAKGELQEFGDDLLRLTRAWLALGNKWFDCIFAVVREVKRAVEEGLQSIQRLIKRIKELVPGLRTRDLRREIQRLDLIVAV